MTDPSSTTIVGIIKGDVTIKNEVCVTFKDGIAVFSLDDVNVGVLFDEHTDQRLCPGEEPPFLVDVELAGEYASKIVIYD